MNIIFLDVDGVLNNWRDAEEIYKKTKKPVIGFEWPFCENSMIALRDLVYKTDSKIVLTSSWRKSKKGTEILLDELEKYQIADKVIGKTPFLKSGKREEEIEIFLKTIEGNVNFVVLDDERYFYNKLKKHLILTDNYYGLQMEDAIKAIEIFKLQKEGKL